MLWPKATTAELVAKPHLKTEGLKKSYTFSLSEYAQYSICAFNKKLHY